MSKECRELNLRSYAKINLCFDITGIRDDGYHLVETVMQQVSLCDDIKMVWESVPGQELQIQVTNSKPYLPTDNRNLAYKAAVIMAENFPPEKSQGNLRIHINKRIPVAAGLGGGSGNGAAVMIWLNRLWRLGMDTKKLCSMGAALGADVPFCILVQNSRYTCALGSGIGDVLTPLKRGLNKYVVLAKPAFGVSTREVFKEIDKYPIEERPETGKLEEGLLEGDMKKVYNNMINVLESYTLKRYPEVQALKERMAKAGASQKILMSGSGPTVMGFYNQYRQARAVCLEMRHQGYEAYWAHTGKEIKGERHDKL